MPYPRKSKIGWCDYSGGDANFVIGCSPISEGCRFCYARRWADRAGIDFSKVQTYPDKLYGLLNWKFTPQPFVRGNGRPLVFVCALSDLFHPDVPAEFIVDAFEIMSARLDVDWIVLTKRPERMFSVLFGPEGNYYLGGGDYFSNIVLGVTAENQTRAEERIPILLENWKGPKMVSIEPLLEPFSLSFLMLDGNHRLNAMTGRLITSTCTGPSKEAWPRYAPLDWVIVGGESGPGHRSMDIAWARHFLNECIRFDVPMFFKQSSGLRPGMNDEPLGLGRVKEWWMGEGR